MDHPRYVPEVVCIIPPCKFTFLCGQDQKPSEVYTEHLRGEAHGIDSLIAWFIAQNEWRRTIRLVVEQKVTAHAE